MGLSSTSLGRARILIPWLLLAATFTIPALAQTRDPSQPAGRPTDARAAADSSSATQEEVEGGAHVAFLNLDRSAIGTMLDAHLRSKKVVNWWPRELTAQLLDQVEPPPFFDLPVAPVAADQARLPDALIFFRTANRGETHVARIVACDPALGLRLGATEVQLSSDAAKDMDQLTTAAIGLLRKMGQPLTELWAVPPFRSQDLTRRHDPLRHSLASQWEQALLARTGAFAVELEYPQALSLARQLAGQKAPIERPLPRIVLGQFRTQADEGQLKASLTISLRYAESIGAAIKTPAAPLSDLDSVVEKAVQELADKPVDVPTQQHDGAAGGQAIARVIVEYEKAGNDDAILSLAEAGLLVNPADLRFRKQALSMLTRMARQHVDALRKFRLPASLANLRLQPEPAPPEMVAEMVRYLGTHHRAIGHCQAVLELPADGGREAHATFAAASQLLNDLGFHVQADLPPQVTRRHEDLRRRRQHLSLQFVQRAAARGYAGNLFVLSELPAAERHALVLRMIVEWRDYPRPEVGIPAYASAALSHGSTTPEEADRFLAQLAALPDPLAQNAAATLRAQRAKAAAARSEPRPPPTETPEPDAPDAEVTFRPLALPFGPARFNNQEALGACELCLPLGDSADLFALRTQIAIAKKRGEAKVIWESERGGWEFTIAPGGVKSPALACYDGRFAWVPATMYGQPPRLLIVDPETEKVVEFTAADGLPHEALSESSRSSIGATPLAAGKVLLAGSFGKSWLAIATFDPEKGKSLKIIHEARDQRVLDDRLQWRSTTLAFDPTYLFTLSGKDDEGKSIQRVLVGRFSQRNPLVVDPEREAVEVLETSLDGASSFVIRDGALYWAAPDLRKLILGTEVIEVWKLAVPELRKELVGRHDLGTRRDRKFSLALEDDRTILVADQWYVADSLEETLRPLRGKLTGAKYHRRRPIRTNHHGWVLHGGYPQMQVFTVEFKDESLHR